MSDISKWPKDAIVAYRMCQQAMLDTKTLRFKYRDAAGAVSEREAEPYEIKDDRLYAWCLQKEALRQFVLGNMTDVNIGTGFLPREGRSIILPC